MASTAPDCPDHTLLASFAAGLAIPAEADRIAAHLVACVACADACETLPPDPLECELRGLSDAGHALSPECAELIRRAHSTTGPALAGAASEARSGRPSSVLADAEDRSEPRTRRLGRYRLVRRIGSGGMGSVHEAVDEVLGRRVAIKIPHAAVQSDPVARERFQREARSAAAVDHPGVCGVLDVGEHEGTSFIAMPLLEGESLAARLARSPRLPLAEALRIVQGLSAAVDAIHAAGIVHRDIKPANVFLTSAGGVVLMDFGIAAAAGANGVDRLTRAGETLGTMGYAAPEQVAGDWEQVGPAADVWAVGVVLYELLSGKTPFAGPPGRVIADILHSEPGRPVPLDPACDRRLVAICLDALSKDPGRRPVRAGVLADRIAAWEAEGGVRRRSRLGGAAALAIGSVIVAGGIWTWRARVEQMTAPVDRQGGPARVAVAVGPAGSAPVAADESLTAPSTANDGSSPAVIAGPEDVFRVADGAKPGGILRATASADGRTIALLHDGPGASIWDVATGDRRRWLPLPPLDTALALSPDGGRLLTAGGGWQVRAWNLETGLGTASLAGHTNWINTIATTVDGRRAVSSSKDGSLRGWDIATGEPLWSQSQGRWVRCCAVSADGARAVCGTQDGFVRLVHVADGQPAGAFRAATEPVVHVAFAAADTVVVAADLSGRLVGWDLATGTTRWERACQAPGSLAVGPTGDLVASTGADGGLELMAVADGAVVARLPAGGSAAVWMAVGFRGPEVLAVRRDGQIARLRRP